MRITFTKTITSQEIRHLLEKLGLPEAGNIEIGGGRVNMEFDPPLTQEQIQVLDQRISKMGYYLIERD